MEKNVFNYLLIASVVSVSMFSCSKKETTVVVTPTVPSSNPIKPGNISGFVKGTLLKDSTYYITGDLTIKAGDTLASQQGVTVIVKNNSQINIQGVLNLVGTSSSPISFNSDSNTPGSWGGFQCDSAQAVTIKWTKILNTGGPDPTGSPRKTIFVAAPINVDVEDCWITNGQDDIIRCQNGAKVNLLRNTILSCGSTDGEAINLKTGVTGTVAYNVIYNQAGTAVKLETSSTIPFPQTEVYVYNNDMISNGWRRGAAEPGRGISIGVNAIGHIYNNIIVNNYQGLELFSDGDTLNTKYGNNLFYASQDTYTDTTVSPSVQVNIRANFYPSDGVGKQQSTDLISTSTSMMNPMFVTYDNILAKPNGTNSSNDFHLQSGSPAFGKGYTKYSNDIGAYTSDKTQSNQH